MNRPPAASPSFSPRWQTALLFLALLSSLAAQDNRIKVDVVMDLTAAGKRLALPTAETPVYYLPVPFGQEDLGPNNGYYRSQPPSKEQTEHLIAVMLASQHYLLMTKTSRPSLILTFKWGFKAPDVMKVSRDDHYRTGTPMASRNNNNMGGVGPHTSSSSTADIFPEIAGSFYVDPNQGAMEDLVGGRLVNFKSIQNETDDRSRELYEMTRYARWYIEITAMDYQAWLHHHGVSLWREYISTDLWGHNLGQVLPTLTKIGGYFVGRELTEPAIMTAAIEIPPGWTTIGQAVVVPEKKKKTKSVWDYQ